MVLSISVNLHASMYLICMQCAVKRLRSRTLHIHHAWTVVSMESRRRNLADNDSREFTIMVPVHGLQVERMGGRREGKDGRAGGRGEGGKGVFSPHSKLCNRPPPPQPAVLHPAPCCIPAVPSLGLRHPHSPETVHFTHAPTLMKEMGSMPPGSVNLSEWATNSTPDTLNPQHRGTWQFLLSEWAINTAPDGHPSIMTQGRGTWWVSM